MITKAELEVIRQEAIKGADRILAACKGRIESLQSSLALTEKRLAAAMEGLEEIKTEAHWHKSDWVEVAADGPTYGQWLATATIEKVKGI